MGHGEAVVLVNVLVGIVAGWATLRLFGGDRPWPWRAGGLPLDVSPRRSGRVSHTRVTGSRPGRSRASSGRRIRSNKAAPRTSSTRHGSVDHGQLAAAVDLLAVAVSAGHTLHSAVGIVARGSRGPLADAFRGIDSRLQIGASLREELSTLPRALGPAARPLAVTLAASLSSGAPLRSDLQRLAEAERSRERRRREERARRLPILLLGPLVGLVLPAFVLLSVAPVVLGMLADGLGGPAAPGT